MEKGGPAGLTGSKTRSHMFHGAHQGERLVVTKFVQANRNQRLRNTSKIKLNNCTSVIPMVT